MGRQLKYDQARLAVLNIIAEDRLQPGDKLAPERQLINRMNCSMITLRKALETLETEGMLERIVGRGTFLRRTVVNQNRKGKILFINMSRSGNRISSVMFFHTHIQRYFEQYGFELHFLQASNFSNMIVNEARDALGILLYGWLYEDFMKSMTSLHLPMIIVGNSPRFSGIPQVELDVIRCAEMVTEEIIRRGAGRIALFNGDPDYYLSSDIETGFRKTMKKHGMELSPDNIISIRNCEVQSRLDSLLPHFLDYDALICELGVYYGILGSCRFNHWELRTIVGVLPILTDEFRTTNSLLRPSDDTVLGCFTQSCFTVAFDMFRRVLLSNEILKDIKIQPELEKETRRDT